MGEEREEAGMSELDELYGVQLCDNTPMEAEIARKEIIAIVKPIIAERDALKKELASWKDAAAAVVAESEEQDTCRGWTYSSLTNAYLGIPEGIGPSARTSMTQPLPPSEEISDG